MIYVKQVMPVVGKWTKCCKLKPLENNARPFAAGCAVALSDLQEICTQTALHFIMNQTLIRISMWGAWNFILLIPIISNFHSEFLWRGNLSHRAILKTGLLGNIQIQINIFKTIRKVYRHLRYFRDGVSNHSDSAGDTCRLTARTEIFVRLETFY